MLCLLAFYLEDEQASLTKKKFKSKSGVIEIKFYNFKENLDPVNPATPQRTEFL